MTKDPCEVDGCERPHYAKRLCKHHYGRQYHGRPLDHPPRTRKTCRLCDKPAKANRLCATHYQSERRTGAARPRCTIADCERAAFADDLCTAHYNRKRQGRPLDEPVRGYGVTGLARAAQRSIRTDSGCLEYRGKLHPSGYGLLINDGRRRQIHVLAYEEVHGPMPDGHAVHHLCVNPPCWEPTHLAAVTPEMHGYLHSRIRNDGWGIEEQRAAIVLGHIPGCTDCGKPVVARLLCERHYRKVLHGHPDSFSA